jgi:hypothetical protein
MKVGATTTSALALGLFLSLLACKKLKGGKESPATEDTAAAQPAAAPEPGKSPEKSDTAELPGKTAIGATAQLNALKVRVAEVKECKYEREANQKAIESAKQKLVGLLVYFEGDYVNHNVQAHAHTWKAYDAEGITYRVMAPNYTDCKPSLKSVSLAKGDKAKGWVAFKVPASTQQLDVKYTHSIPVKLAKESAKQLVTFRALGN